MNWDMIVSAMIGAAPTTILATLSVWQQIRTHDIVNHKMDQMLQLNRDEATASATLAEKAAENTRKGDAAIAAETKKDS